MGIYTVQQKVITWQATTIEAESIEQAIELAVDKDDWYGIVDVDETVDVFWVETHGKADGTTYAYNFDGKLIKEQN